MKRLFLLFFAGVLYFTLLSGCNVNDVINAANKEGVGKAIQKIEVTTDSMNMYERDDQERLEKQTKNWAIMIYGSIDIEPNSEKSLLQELMDMVDVGNAGNSIHLLAQIDYRKDKNIPSKRYYIEKGKLVVKGSFPNTNTGDPKTFEGFLRWAMSYPARHRMLFVQGHGTGWISLTGPGSIDENILTFYPAKSLKANTRSFGYDQSSNDCITLKEASSVFNKVLGREKIDILAFRSCLMDEVETAYQFSKYFNYLVATETTQQGVVQNVMTALSGIKGGFDTYVLQLLKERKGNVSPKDLSLAMYTSLKNTNEKILNSMGNKHEFEIACLDLNILKRIVIPVRNLGIVLRNGLDYSYPERNKLVDIITESRDAAPKFGGIFKGMYLKVPDDYEYVDLGIFAHNLSEKLKKYSKQFASLNTQLAIDAASDITNILKNATLARSNTNSIKGSFATSIFLAPPRRRMPLIYSFLLEDKYHELDFNTYTEWDNVIHYYHQPKKH